MQSSEMHDATAAPTAVAVSAKPITSLVSGYASATNLPRAFIIASALFGETGICFACNGSTSR